MMKKPTTRAFRINHRSYLERMERTENGLRFRASKQIRHDFISLRRKPVRVEATDYLLHLMLMLRAT